MDHRPRPSTLLALWLSGLLALMCGLAQGAEPPAPAPPAASALPGGSWAAELETLTRWLDEQRRGKESCGDRCFVLDRLKITGNLGGGPLDFELTGGVLGKGPVAVPLFGPPDHVRIEGATEDGREAAIGFEGDHYYLFTASKRFVLRGKVSLVGDLALLVPGPLNTFEGDLEGGAVVEGARLSGLRAATVHMTREGSSEAASGPTVFQLSRAVRVGREIGFEYRLVMQSGTDLGVVRLPLAFGENVLEVKGSTGFHVEGTELVLPTSGRSAQMTITGSLSKVGAFSPDPRSGYEWWLFESDAEHRVVVQGDARQVDAAESPIQRSQASSRLFLVQKGQHVEVAVQPLTSLEVLAAVVRDHDRTVVLTRRGDLVSDDTLSYENNGIDYLLYGPSGRPIYLATDGKAERIMHQGEGASDVLVPLKTGSHMVRAQALSQASLQPAFGALTVPMPSYPLTASRVRLTLGVPPGVLPLAMLGGDRPEWAGDAGDLVAFAVALGAAWIFVRPPPGATRGRARGLRLLGFAVLSGLWLIWPGGYVVALVVLSAAGLVALIARWLRGPGLVVASLALLGGAGLVALIGLLAAGSASRSSSEPSRAYDKVAAAPAPGVTSGDDIPDRTGNFLAQTAGGGVLEGVTPVALNLPSYERAMSVSRELVTKERPFSPVLVYVTEWVTGPLEALWLLAALALLFAQRAPLADLVRRVRERLSAPTTPGFPAGQAPSPPPPREGSAP